MLNSNNSELDSSILNNTLNLVKGLTSLNKNDSNRDSQFEKIFFYNRLDHKDILLQLSPLRSLLNKAIPFLYYIGLITNALCILILTQKSMINRKSIFYLVILSFSDFMYNFLSELPNFLIRLKLTDHDIFKTSDFACFFYDYRTSIFHFYSVLITLFVTYDRFYHIYNPLNLSGKFETNKSKIKAGLVLLLTSAVVALPHGFLMVYNQTEKDCDARSFFKNKIQNTTFTYYQIYFTFTEPILFWFCPGLLILFMNFYVIYKIIDSNQSRPNKLGVRKMMPTKSSYNDEFSRRFNSSFKSTHQKSKTSFKKLPNEKINFDEMDSLSLINMKKNLNNKDNKKNSHLNLTSKSLRTTLACDQDQQHKKMKKLISSQSLKSNFETATLKSIQSEFLQKQINQKNDPNKLSVNQLSHYITIITVGFYFILSTIPFGIMLSFQNNLTLKLDYYLRTKEDYLNDSQWVSYGFFRDCASVTKLFFISNHVFNFILYYLFNNLFRKTFHDLFIFKFKHCFDKLRNH